MAAMCNSTDGTDQDDPRCTKWRANNESFTNYKNNVNMLNVVPADNLSGNPSKMFAPF